MVDVTATVETVETVVVVVVGGGGDGSQSQGRQDSDGGEEAQNKCVRCMQWWCCGCGLVAWSHFVRGLEGAAQLFIILMIRAPVQCVCTLDRLNFV